MFNGLIADGLDLEFGTDIEVESSTVEVLTTEQIKSLTEDSIIPKDKNILGLDISQNSSGICIYRNGIKTLYNAWVEYDKANVHAEAYIRYQLKNDLLEVIGDTFLDIIIIEDVFEGDNPEVVRRLYALNTAIDDLILEGKVKCDKFIRVPNGTWKRWLSTVDKNNIYKGYRDKERIQGYLELIGITDEGKGFQDRLDATGMIIGYLLCGENFSVNQEKYISVSFNDISFAFESDIDLVSDIASSERVDGVNIVLIDDIRLSKKKITSYISSDYECVYITKEPIRLGLLADTLNLDLLNGKGHLGFWLSDSAMRKYKRKIEKKNIQGVF